MFEKCNPKGGFWEGVDFFVNYWVEKFFVKVVPTVL